MDLKYIVNDNKYKTIKNVLKTHFCISNRLITKLKQNNKILLNQKVSHINTTLHIGDEVNINLDFNEISDNIVSVKMDLNIIYEDEYLLIVNKTYELPVHPSMLHYNNSLSNGVKYYFESNNIKRKIRAVNRLDKDTSGIVIFAKNEYIQECLIKQMKSKTFKKYYLAILEGNLENKKGTINAPISRKENSIIEREINEKGAVAITHYKLIKNFTYKMFNFALVEFELETGRTHQIRVHSKYINHPILGDTLYGNASSLISRQALHAYKVSFLHPVTKQNIMLETELPDDIKKIL